MLEANKAVFRYEAYNASKFTKPYIKAAMMKAVPNAKFSDDVCVFMGAASKV